MNRMKKSVVSLFLAVALTGCSANTDKLAGSVPETESERITESESITGSEGTIESESTAELESTTGIESTTELESITESEPPDSGETTAGEKIKIVIYNMTADTLGKDEGVLAKILENKFNVELEITNDIERDDLDIVAKTVLDPSAIPEGMEVNPASLPEAFEFLEWTDELLDEHGQNIKKYLQPQMDGVTDLFDGKRCGVYGWRTAVDGYTYDCSTCFALRWDLASKSGIEKASDLEKFVEVLVKMKEITDRDDVYAFSADDREMNTVGIYPAFLLMMSIFGSDFSVGGANVYDYAKDCSYPLLDDNSPYLDALKLLNTFYRAGLLDPDMKGQSMDAYTEKLNNDQLLIMSFYSTIGFDAYNDDEQNTAEDKIYMPYIPKYFNTVNYAEHYMDTSIVVGINSRSKHAELAMDILNWLVGAEGMISAEYGPKGVCWDVDDDGYYYLTETGWAVYYKEESGVVDGYDFGEVNKTGSLIYQASSIIPGSLHNEVGIAKSWKLENGVDRCEAEGCWKDYTGYETAYTYIDENSIKVENDPEEKIEVDEESKEWLNFKQVIVDYSWKAVYAESEDEYESIITEMREKADEAGYQDFVLK